MNIDMQTLNAALAEEKALWDQLRDADLDIRVAERAGDPAVVDSAKETRAELQGRWYKLRLANAADVALAMQQIGLNPEHVRRALS